MSNTADAILTALRGAMPGGVAVYDTLIPGIPPNRYLVLYSSGGLRESYGVDAVSDCVYLSFQVTTVASDPTPAYSAATCRWLQILVRDSLTDLVVNADGHAPGRIRHDGTQSPQPDETTPDKKVYATDQFSLTTVRTA